MSRFRPDRLRIRLDAGELYFALKAERTVRVWAKPMTAAGEPSVSRWRLAIDHLVEELHGSPRQPGTRVDVILGASWVHYLVIPWDAAFATPSARVGYAKHCFRDTYGELAATWDVRVADAAYGQASLASAADQGFIEHLEECIRDAKLRLESIQPELMDAYGQSVQRINTATFWFVVTSAESHTMFLQRDGVPLAVQQAARTDGPLPVLIERITRALGLELGRCPVFCAERRPDSPTKDGLTDWKLSTLDAPSVSSGAPALFNAQRTA